MRSNFERNHFLIYTNLFIQQTLVNPLIYLRYLQDNIKETKIPSNNVISYFVYLALIAFS